ncbi:MAG: hypothetical protein QW793_04910 [Candidatus Caldarchaeum sp.]
MAFYPQLDTVIESMAQPVTIRRISHSVSEYGSPVASAQDWVTKGSISNATAEDDQLFQGLVTGDSKKIYLRGEAQAHHDSETKTVRELMVYPTDYVLIEGTEYRIVSIRDYLNMTGFLVLLIRAVKGGG